jgi:hypothetical protein
MITMFESADYGQITGFACVKPALRNSWWSWQ